MTASVSDLSQVSTKELQEELFRRSEITRLNSLLLGKESQLSVLLVRELQQISCIVSDIRDLGGTADISKVRAMLTEVLATRF